LNRPSAQIYGGSISIENLNEIILEGGTGIAAASINLADDDTVGAGLYRARRSNQN
jgi:hypothetical protein